jgi:uncharacterized membrane protein (UPF0182 family)
VAGFEDLSFILWNRVGSDRRFGFEREKKERVEAINVFVFSKVEKETEE